MRYEDFLARLPGLFDAWGSPAARPLDGRFAALAAALPCFSAAGTLQLLNLAVGLLEPGEVYCEAGSHRGCTLVGALTGNGDARALALPTPAVDHPSFWNGLHVLTWDRAAPADPPGRHDRLAAAGEPAFVEFLHEAGYRYELRAGRIPAGRLPTDW